MAEAEEATVVEEVVVVAVARRVEGQVDRASGPRRKISSI